MKIIKKLDIFILKAYLLLFAGTFFICLFIFLMQFVWRYVEQLVGKGLSWDVLAKFFYYSSLMLVPTSLPLAVLLASLISFGNFGERFELLSMKAAGVPLTRILQPIFLFVLLVCGASFYFQNKIGPEANKQMATLIWSLKQKSPELEIPEGIFYSEIPGHNIYVEHKNRETGMLYGVMIYNMTDGYDDAQIVLADSARLQSTADKMYLKLTLYNGERFKNMDNNGANMFRANIPYMRESFILEEDLIPFDANFNMMDAGLFAGDARTKGLKSIIQGVDSLTHKTDSVGRAVMRSTMNIFMTKDLPSGTADSMQFVQHVAEKNETIDSIYARFSEENKLAAWKSALNKAQNMQSEYEYRAIISDSMNRSLRMHKIEAHKKFSMAIACMLFFFIGAPLGAIIRKGGLGVPVVVSVLFFIFYYIVNMGGEKMAKTAEWNVVSGVWFSSLLLFAIGMFLVNRANKDSVVFNIEAYRAFFQRLLGLRTKRIVNRKEVIIQDPDYASVSERLTTLMNDCRLYIERARLHLIPNYWKLYFRFREDHEVIDMDERLEELVKELHNTRDGVILECLNELPILVPDAHTRPFHDARKNIFVGIFLPLGIFFFFRIWRYRLRLWRDMQQIQKIGKQINDRIIKEYIPNNG